MVLMREIDTGDWQLMRDVRLAALSEAPYAFGSTYAQEAAFTEERWRARISERSVTFFAQAEPAGTSDQAGEQGAAPAGLAGVYVEDGQAELVSMWVRPSAHGLGVGEALVEAAAAWAKARDYPALFLWVTESNGAASRLYQRCGFTPTGERQPLPSDETQPEIRMSRLL
jgi:ribosomal protein S18 acetylase RimI-like enzyme